MINAGGKVLLLVSALWMAAGVFAAEAAPSWETFQARYRDFLGAGSQALLPFPQLGPQAWQTLERDGGMQRVFAQADVFYNAKSYVFTLYRAPDGRYYLDAKGGFWGMDRLVYGPLEAATLRPE